jgi:hypothetical protein
MTRPAAVETQPHRVESSSIVGGVAQSSFASLASLPWPADVAPGRRREGSVGDVLSEVQAL